VNKTTADLVREREEAVSTARLTQDPERHLQSLEDLAEIFLRADSYLPALQNLDECIEAAERLGLGESRTATLELKAAQALIDKADSPAPAGEFPPRPIPSWSRGCSFKPRAR
jgi:hypothetical protein